MRIRRLRPTPEEDEALSKARIDLAALHRITWSSGWSEAVVNHMALVVGETISKSFQTLCYLDRVANMQLRAMSTEQPIQTISEKLATGTKPFFRQHYLGKEADMHFDAIKRMLDRQGADYAA